MQPEPILCEFQAGKVQNCEKHHHLERVNKQVGVDH